MKKKALVIGQGSYVGQHLVKLLENQDFLTIKLLPYSTFSNSSLWLKSIHEALKEELPEAVFYISACQTLKETSEVLEELIFTNTTAPVSIASKIIELGFDCRMTITGTWWQYDENGNETPCNPYTATKISALKIISSLKKLNLKVAQTVLFDIYGPNDTRPKFINLLIENLALNQKIHTTAGHQEIDLTHIEDVVSGIFLTSEMLKEYDSNAEILNIGLGTRKPESLRSVIEKIVKTTKTEPSIEWGAIPYRDFEKMKTWKTFNTPNHWKPRQFGESEILELINSHQRIEKKPG